MRLRVLKVSSRLLGSGWRLAGAAFSMRIRNPKSLAALQHDARKRHRWGI